MDIPKAYDPSKVEDKWYNCWEERGYLHSEVNREKTPFSIVIPPPNITGKLHLGHALNNILQDIVIRYKRMDGYNACWFPGMDHAGIATQNVVEQELEEEGLTRYDLGRERFVERVWEWKKRYGDEIIRQLKALGASCDWNRTRFTLDEGLSKAVQEVFIKLYEQGFIYRGEYIINWCPRCQTAISDIEVEHEEHEGKLYYIKYPVANSDEFITVATTRPESMLGDTAVAVHPEDERYKGLVGRVAILPLIQRRIPIIADEVVDPEFGTGAVKVTPGHDPTDFEIGDRHDLERINILGADGTMNENAGRYAGLDRYECRESVVEELKKEELLGKVEDYLHAIGHCQRCGTVIEPLISTQWFLRMKELAKPAIEAIRKGEVLLIPKQWEKVYFDWMKNIRDWCISRQLWWGHRIPAWYCRNCGEITVSREPPKQCSACGSKNLVQDEDVLDTWFSSALWPFSVMGWPEATPELDYFYPTSLLVTAYDILFFWVARMIIMGLHFTHEVPFEKVLFHPMIKDERGRPMSKSLGNVIDPMVMKEGYGVDALRFSLAASMAKGREMRLSERDIEGGRKFLNKIWNAARLSLMNLEGFKQDKGEGTSCLSKELPQLELEDRWILSRLTRELEDLRKNLENYDFNLAAEGLYSFIWHDFCDWYLEMIKPRLYGGKPERKRSAQQVLYLVLSNILKMLHPFIPFITEEIFSKLPQPEAESLMIAPFPKPERELINPEVEGKVNALQSLITAIRTIRSEMNVPPHKKVKALIKVEDKEISELVAEYRGFFYELAGVSEIVVGKDIERPERAPRKVLEEAEIFVPLEDLVDIAKERNRLKKELEQVKREFAASSRKLNNEQFLEKAPAEVVEKEKGKVKEFKERAKRLKENLETLGIKS